MKNVLALVAALVLDAAQAAAPTATDLPVGFSFVEYTGTATVGIGAVDTDSTLYFIDEKSVGGFKSWYVFFDPAAAQNVTATLTFSAPIVDVFVLRIGINATTPTFGADGISYGSRPLMGLEPRDSLDYTVGGNTLALDWVTVDPGDHIRVLTAVPEPATQALLAAGVLAVGIAAYRRR